MCTVNHRSGLSAVRSGCWPIRLWSPQLLLCFLALALLVPADAGKDYYKILGVSSKADDKLLKRAYKKQAMKWHPDKHQKNKDAATAKFQEIAEAYETLSDPEKRKIYDLGGEEAVKGQPGPQQQDASGPSGRTHFAENGPGGTHWFYTQGGPGERAGPEIDPRLFQEAFAKMFAGADSGSSQWGGTHRGKPTAGSSSQAKRTSAKQGGPLFTSSHVQELSFEDHEAQIQALRQHGPSVVLFYASGGKSCPEACHRIQSEYKKLAESKAAQVAIAAVQCKRRKGKCAEYADRFPAVVLFEKGGHRETVMSASSSASSSLLKKKIDKVVAKKHHAQELQPDHFTVDGDPCDGQFCLLLLERGPVDSAVASRRAALAAAAEQLRGEPVKVFYVQADKYADFARPFETASTSAFMGSFRRLPAAQVILYRPKRKRFEIFEGNVETVRDLVDFAEKAIHRGTPLSQKMKSEPRMTA
eukprot:TRINITY_DN72863_c0_g1_i1.p1 TRINITY_DN72863_c0_g1~~TRINITY_DN72863_c0_g1_i1.p1  ORF type:complete len:472 (-),score=111.80 TRINITY_DN72863_c0_g1_i1:206-1621(-)